MLDYLVAQERLEALFFKKCFIAKNGTFSHCLLLDGIHYRQCDSIRKMNC